MESVPQPSRKSKGVSIPGALAGMLVTFVGGIYVGLHPAWIPIKGSGNSDVGEPVTVPAPTIMAAPDHPAALPATRPTTSGT